jgi:hypothetical protein
MRAVPVCSERRTFTFSEMIGGFFSLSPEEIA